MSDRTEVATQSAKRGFRRTRKPKAANDMSIFGHLAELRKRIFISLLALGAGAIVAFFMWDWILDVTTKPYCDAQIARGVITTNGASSCQLYISNPLELLTTRVTVSTYLGFVFASPVIFWQLWRFITPGLNKNEKRYAVPFVTTSVLLFAAGCAVAWFTLPQAMKFFLAVGGSEITTLFNPTPYLKLVFLMMLLFGIAFETPLLLVFLQIAGIVTSKQLRSFRRYAIVINSIIAAVATPSADPYSMLAMFIPLVLFYEGAIIVGRVLKK